jgi:hypothetical protein
MRLRIDTATGAPKQKQQAFLTIPGKMEGEDQLLRFLLTTEDD